MTESSQRKFEGNRIKFFDPFVLNQPDGKPAAGSKQQVTGREQQENSCFQPGIPQQTRNKELQAGPL
jgi:hypothetical protein